MRKLTGPALSLLVGALLGVVVGVIAARLSHVSTFITSGSTVADGPRQAVEFRRSAQSMVTLAIAYGSGAALVVVVVAASFRVRLVKDSTNRHGWVLTVLCLVTGVLVGGAAVLLAHIGSYTAIIHAGQVSSVRPSWLPSLPIAIGIGAIAGAVCAQVLRSAGLGLMSSKERQARRSVTAT